MVVIEHSRRQSFILREGEIRTQDAPVRVQLRSRADDDNHGSCAIPNSKYLQRIQELAGLLKSCKDLSHGKRVHAKIYASEHRGNRYLANLLVEMYGKCGSLKDAREVFNGMNRPNVFSWNIIVAAYARNGCLHDSREFFDRMPERDVVSWTAMVTAYAQNGHLEDARSMFDRMPQRNVVSWNIMIAAYAQYGHLEEAGRLFDRIPHPDVVTWTSLMAAYAQNGYLEEAKSMFNEMPEKDVVSWTVMLQAYAQTGDLQGAMNLFNTMPDRNVVSWNAMLQGYAHNGGFELAQLMNLEGVKPDENTFISILNACSHLGLIGESLEHFASISADHGETPTAEHCCCMIDIFGRVGLLDEAEAVLKHMPDLPDGIAWATLTSAAKMHGDLERGAWAARFVFTLDPENSAPYVLLSNIYNAKQQSGTKKPASYMSSSSNRNRQAQVIVKLSQRAF